MTALPQPSRLNTPDAEWLPIEAVCDLTGESARTWRWRAQREALDAGKLRRNSRAMKGEAEGWMIHRSMDSRLARGPDRATRDVQDRKALLEKHPQHHIDRAMRKYYWLERWRRECERCADRLSRRDLAARVVAEAVEREGQTFKISVSSLFGWWNAYNRCKGDRLAGLEALIDRFNGPRPAGEDTSDTNRAAEAIEWFYSLYRMQNRLSAKHCHDATLREARRHGWAWPVSYGAAVAWMKAHDDRSLTYLLREGQDVWARRYMPHNQIDYTTIEPGFMYTADHTQCDFWASYKGKPIRPWLTAIQDLRTRCIVGWHVGPAAHQDAIIAALRMAFRDWAIPSVMRIDNGRDFTSKAITGLTKQERGQLQRLHGDAWADVLKRDEASVTCTDPRWLGIAGELGIELVYAIPYAPWSKGTIERWFRTFEDNVARTYATYCGNNTLTKPECVEEIRRDHPEAVPDIDAVRERVGQWLDIYHRSAHRGQGMNGAAPLEVWEQAASLRRAFADELAFLMDVRGPYKVGGNGVTVKVGQASVHYGAACAALKAHVGREVLIAVDPADIARCWAFTPDRQRRKLISALAANEYVEPYTNADDAREAIAEKMRERSGMRKASASAANRTLKGVQRINQHSRAKRMELLATGTDHAVAVPSIVPVRTGFEGVSKAVRSVRETAPPEPVGDLSEMFDAVEVTTPRLVRDDDDERGMEDLLEDEPAREEEGDGLESLL